MEVVKKLFSLIGILCFWNALSLKQKKLDGLRSHMDTTSTKKIMADYNQWKWRKVFVRDCRGFLYVGKLQFVAVVYGKVKDSEAIEVVKVPCDSTRRQPYVFHIRELILRRIQLILPLVTKGGLKPSRMFINTLISLLIKSRNWKRVKGVLTLSFYFATHFHISKHFVYKF